LQILFLREQISLRGGPWWKGDPRGNRGPPSQTNTIKPAICVLLRFDARPRLLPLRCAEIELSYPTYFDTAKFFANHLWSGSGSWWDAL
jgi:hypothetical protein